MDTSAQMNLFAREEGMPAPKNERLIRKNDNMSHGWVRHLNAERIDRLFNVLHPRKPGGDDPIPRTKQEM